jgi:hypothetical protein
MGRIRASKSDNGVSPEDRPVDSGGPLAFHLTTPDALLGDIASFLIEESNKIFIQAKDAPHMEKHHLKGVAHTIKALAFRIDHATLETLTVIEGGVEHV